MSKPVDYKLSKELFVRALILQSDGKLTRDVFREILLDAIDAQGDEFQGIGGYAAMAEAPDWLDGIVTMTSGSRELALAHSYAAE